MRENLCRPLGFVARMAVCAAVALTLANSSCTKNPAARMAQQQPVEIATASGVKMVYLAGGEFMMGSKRGNKDEAPRHLVVLGGFLIDKTEVTNGMFRKAEFTNGSHWQDHPHKPVTDIRWNQARLYCNERSRMEGLKPCYDTSKPGAPCDFSASGYRLPTEAEWEYACRAGNSSDQDFGFGPVAKLKQFAIFNANGSNRTHPVDAKKPNAWGIQGLYGNVCEWCEDVYRPDYYASSPPENPTGPESGAEDAVRVVRGGSWKATPRMCRAAFRQGRQTGDTDACFASDFCGFRCVRRPSAEEIETLLAFGEE